MAGVFAAQTSSIPEMQHADKLEQPRAVPQHVCTYSSTRAHGFGAQLGDQSGRSVPCVRGAFSRAYHLLNISEGQQISACFSACRCEARWARHQRHPICATHFGGKWIAVPWSANRTGFVLIYNCKLRVALHIASQLPSWRNPCLCLELTVRCGPWPGAGKQTSQGEDRPGPGLGTRPQHAGRRVARVGRGSAWAGEGGDAMRVGGYEGAEASVALICLRSLTCNCVLFAAFY